MASLLLHSGKTDQYRPLGETGQPVYHSALQLRKAIARRLKGRERHLAIPQRDQQGEGVDWYSSLEGDVVPWKSATEGEREDARIQLEAFRKEIQAVENPKEGQGGDQEVFARLIKWVCHFPDEDFVYLVNGTPVLTFWGFIHPETDRHANPLQCLYPEAAPEPSLANPALAPTAPFNVAPPVNEPAVTLEPTPRPWWRRYWWMWPLLLLLGLLLLLLGLRACSPRPPLWGTDINRPTLTAPGFSASQPRLKGLDVWPFNTGTRSLALPNGTLRLNSDSGLPTFSGGLGTRDIPSADISLPETTPVPETASLPDTTSLPAVTAPDISDTNPISPSAGTPALEPAPPSGQPEATPPPPEPLSLPESAPEGAASFLNGQWQGAGVMDSQSGQPLQVRYAFDQGDGQMYIRRGGREGVTCAGPVAAVMQNGELQIEAQERARCDDGSNYEMPRVECRQNEGEMADCAASYDDEPFPMRLQKASE